MKTLILISLLAVAALAQPSLRTRAEWLQLDGEKSWKEAGRTVHEPMGYWLYEKFLTRGDDVEVWLRHYIPSAALKARNDPKLKRYGYSAEFMTFHCRDERVSVEKVYFYSTSGNLITSGPGDIDREPIPPDSVFAVMFRHFCLPVAK